MEAEERYRTFKQHNGWYTLLRVLAAVQDRRACSSVLIAGELLSVANCWRCCEVTPRTLLTQGTLTCSVKVVGTACQGSGGAKTCFRCFECPYTRVDRHMPAPELKNTRQLLETCFSICACRRLPVCIDACTYVRSLSACMRRGITGRGNDQNGVSRM